MSEGLWEREAERAALLATMASAARGQGTATFFAAQPGLGKTRLLTEAGALAGRRFSVARAAGQEMEVGYPYGMVHQVVAGLLRGTGGRLIATQPVLRAFARGQRRGGRTELAYALFWLLSCIAERRPLLLLLDDLQWADPDSLEFWRFVACRAGGQRLALVCALRPWPSQAEDMLNRLIVDGHADLHVLRPLSAHATRSLLGDALGAAPTAELARRAIELTRGNPLLIQSLARLAHAGLDLPSGSDVLALRLEGLPGEAQRLLGAASVLGAEFDLDLAAAITGLTPAAAHAALQPLVALELISPGPRPGRHVSTHPLLRQMAEQALAPCGRSALHHEALAILRGRGAPASALVPHVLAAPPEAAEAIAVLRAAAREADGQAAYETAAAHLRQALRIGAPESTRADILYDLGRAVQRAGEQHAASAAFAEAAALAGCPPGLRGAIHRSWALSLTMAGEVAAAREQLERAVADAAGAGRWTEAAEFLVARAVIEMTAGAFAAGREAALRALSLARRGGGASARAKALAVWSNIAFLRGHPLAYRRARAALALLPAEPPDETEQFWGWSVPTALAMIAMRSERYHEAESLFADMAAAASQRRARYVAVWAFTFRAELAWRQGRLRDAARLVEDALQLPEQVPWATALALAVRGQVLVDLGQLEDAEASIRRAEADVAAARLGPALLWARGARAALAAGRGDHATAADLLLAGVRAAADLGIRDPGMLPWQADAAEACLRCGRAAEASELAGELLAGARRFGRRGLESVALRLRGMLAAAAGQEEGAMADFASAEAMQTELDLPMELGRTLLARGRIVRRAGDRRQARAILAQAEDVLAACGAERWRREAEGERLAAGGRRRGLADPLTPQERRIADLVAAGRTNRQIAATLLVSPKTLETHLHHIYGKLGCDSRPALQEKIRGEA
ncbi:MAG TPA: LuxR C-terminal-related transcriptional regulator [Bacillota bacterium]|nr:LuxR C-terminal-related transcriptional regulator [Bacillota bacterium]